MWMSSPCIKTCPSSQLKRHPSEPHSMPLNNNWKWWRMPHRACHYSGPCRICIVPCPLCSNNAGDNVPVPWNHQASNILTTGTCYSFVDSICQHSIPVPMTKAVRKTSLPTNPQPEQTLRLFAAKGLDINIDYFNVEVDIYLKPIPTNMTKLIL